ncbi:MAG: DUF3187 family protein [Deltaproteobacteria bacterium]|nr:DUF3187 family protein [Deltaproteobacteria bacterium]
MNAFTRCVAGVAGLAILGVSGALAAREPFPAHGPIPYRHQHPLYLQSLGLTPMRAVALPRGDGVVGLRMEHSNIFEQFINTTADVRIDTEQLRMTVDLAYGLPHNFTLEAEIPFVHTGGGRLDSFLQWWHSVLGVPNAGREFFTNDQHVFRILDRPSGAERYQVAPIPLALGDASLRLRHHLVTETARRPAIGWFAACEFPTGKRSQGLGNGNLDYGVGLLMEKNEGRWHGYFNGGYFVSAGTPALADAIHPIQFNYVVGGEFSVSRQVALHAQLHGGTPLLTGLGDTRWDSFPLDLMMGMSGEHPVGAHGERILWQVGLSEDLNANGPSIDVTLFGRVGWRWKGL